MRSNVPDADVYVEGEFRGSTGHEKQLKIELNEGSYRVQVKKAGYEDAQEQQVKVAAKPTHRQNCSSLRRRWDRRPIPPDVGSRSTPIRVR